MRTVRNYDKLLMVLAGLFGVGGNNCKLLVGFVGISADIERANIRQIMIALYASLSAACNVSLFGFVWFCK